SISCRERYWFVPCVCASGTFSSVLDQELRPAGEQFFSWGPSRVPEGRGVGGGTLIGGCAKPGRGPVGGAWGEEHCESFELVRWQLGQHQGGLFGACPDDRRFRVVRERARPELFDGQFGAADLRQFTVVGAAEPAPRWLWTGTQEVALETVGG